MGSYRPRDGEGPRVLVVDDDRALQSLLKALLDDYGCPTTVVNNGEEALAALERGEEFDLVVLDLEMPVMDGVAFYREAQQRNLSLPTLMLTAQWEGRRIARELGVERVLNKPFDIDDLVDAVLALHRGSSA